MAENLNDYEFKEWKDFPVWTDCFSDMTLKSQYGKTKLCKITVHNTRAYGTSTEDQFGVVNTFKDKDSLYKFSRTQMASGKSQTVYAVRGSSEYNSAVVLTFSAQSEHFPPTITSSPEIPYYDMGELVYTPKQGYSSMGKKWVLAIPDVDELEITVG